LRRSRRVDVLPGEDVADLADAVYLVSRLADERQVVRTLRLEREIVPVRGAHVVPRLADERPRDHTADCMVAGQDLPGDATRFVELLQRDRLLVCCHLKDRVG
jgi:hypothetical protein